MSDDHWAPRAQLPDLRGVLDPADVSGRKNRHIDAIHKLALSTYAPVPRGARVLDFGCGVGRMSQYLARRAAVVTGLDVVPEMVAAAAARDHSERIRYVLAEAGEPLPLEDGSIDYVLSIGVLQHILEPDALGAVLAEFHRVLTGGGTVAIIEQVRDSEQHRDAGFKVQRLAAEYVAAFQQAGFRSPGVRSIRIPSPFTNWVGSGRLRGPAAGAAVAADMVAARLVRSERVYRDSLMVFRKASG